MIIGIDFDNTIADYTGAFHHVGMKLGWLPKEVGQTKEDVKAYFINTGNEPKWTELQGIVYGKEINLAKPYLGCLKTLQQLKAQGYTLKLVSHKTKYPIIGEKVDFHIAATNWLKSNHFLDKYDSPFIQKDLFFNETEELKISLIRQLQCDIFIDDLQSILCHPSFPLGCKKVWFNNSGSNIADLPQLTSWSQLSILL
ncbi:hypothetical protein [Marinomonas sp. 2405UD68-3]|uniref:hypothetical protein n=1 Tax=Marinomonas sp. 2405UD68-3 TaxID=3391835 RepID=UPI0039C906D2